jgi:4-hydroxythreonine-4-phosphate dehydrogenase
MNAPAVLALTMGEPAGIGGEIALKAWLGRKAGVPPFFILDDASRLEELSRQLDLGVPISAITDPAEAYGLFDKALPVLHRPLAAMSRPGHPHPANAKAVIAAIEEAVHLVVSGRAAAVVTNPIHKRSLYAAGFSFPGHTEFLAALAGSGSTAVMMLACPDLRVVPVTVHMSLRRAIEELSTEIIVATAKIAWQALRGDFGIERPRLAIAGLNPHAGEDGEIGREDLEIVAPAVTALKAHHMDVFGPVPPDTLFSPRSRPLYDAAICMYHDQALIPLKTLDFDGGVNITLGLPFVRTSPDHGTAFDLAGSGQASETSLVAALRMAAMLARRRCERRP